MLRHPVFAHHSLRKVIISFGNLFKDLYIERRNRETDELQKYLLVPISYGPKQKWIHRIKQNPILEAGNVAIVMPRMAFVIDSVTYDPERKLQSTTFNTTTLSPTEKGRQFVPVPWDVNISLFILSDNAEDATQILEQILPFFTPEFTLTVNTIPEMGIANDIPVILNSATVDDNFDTEFEDKRMIIWTLQYTIKSYVYGPIKEQGIIKRVIENIKIPMGGSGTEITCQDISKAGTAVRITTEPDPYTAGPDDEFEIKQTFEDFPDEE